MAKNQSADTEISDINIVPLVDIILVVLIIFMVTSQTQKQNQMELNLPESSFSEKKPELPLAISLNKSREIFINQKLTDLNELKSQIGIELNKNPDISAVVSADKDLDYGLVIAVMDAAKSAGVKELSVTTVETP
ncbi:MAG: biopolymer transporter ExbD [Bdellovibrionaceae bacterium]|nr:biopolymer transporter ExbD [Pseudobdellovibrionaceae bacterium]